MSVKVNKILSLARECIGTPFVHQGRTCGKGQDCAGPLAHIFQGFDMEYVDKKAYPRTPYNRSLENNLDSQPHLKKVPKSELKAGDIVIFRIETSPQHIGIYTGENLIHACSVVGRVVEQPFRPYKPQLKLVYRIIE